MKLTAENYFSNESNWEYWSNSQFKDFESCQARAMAKLYGWKSEESIALIQGKYFHALLESNEIAEKYIETFKKLDLKSDKRRGVLTQKGDLTAAMQIAHDAYERVIKDDFIVASSNGEKEKIITAELFGVKWKAMIDVYNAETKSLTDYKLLKDFKDIYINGAWENVFTAYGYDRQMALYCEIDRVFHNREENDYFMPYITAVTKEKITNYEIVTFVDECQNELADFVKGHISYVQAQIDRHNDVKTGFTKPTRCGECEYCIETKKLNETKHYLSFGRN